MKAIDILINSILPEDLRGDHSYDKKSIDKLMAAVATKYPERYAEIAKKISDVGRHAAYRQGETLTLSDMRVPIDRDKVLTRMDRDLDMAGTSSQGDELERNRNTIFARYAQELEKSTIEAAMAQRNNLANTVVSGARGNFTQLRGMLTTPALYTDYKDRIIPRFVRNSFGEGVRPADYLAGAFGVRKSVMSTKNATADAGDLGKQLVQSAANLVVTEDDCGSTNGISVDPDDNDTIGRVLSQDVAGLKAGTVIDRHAAQHLRKKGVKNIIARSAMTCQAEHGICSHCLGQSGGKFAPVGYSAGITAAQALCLAEGTLVRMADGGHKPIESIIPGEFVLGSSKAGILRPVRVMALHDNGEQPCVLSKYRVRNDQIVELVSTPNHRVLFQIKDRGEEISNPTEMTVAEAEGSGDRAYAVLPRGFDDTGLAQIPEARLLGVLLGDGCINGGMSSGGIGLSCYDPDMLKDLQEDFEQIGMTLRHLSSGEYRLSSYRGPNNELQATANGEQVKNPLKRVLINEELWGKRAKEKTLPKSIHEWDNESVYGLLAGLIATDGHVVEPREGRHVKLVGFSSNSKLLLDGVRHLLQTRVGVPCGEIGSSVKRKYKDEFYDPTYHLSVCGDLAINTLHARLGHLIPGVKRLRLKRAAEFELTGATRYSQNAWLKSVEPAGVRRTYDLEIDHEDHFFLLENLLLVHNSEPLTQGALSDKHTAGAFKGERRTFAGFNVINCLAEDTLVRMADGRIIPVQKISRGDLVLGADKSGNSFSVRVTNVFDNGVQSCFEYKFRVGQSEDVRSVVCTPNHKILAQCRKVVGKEGTWSDFYIEKAGKKTSYPFSAVLVQGRHDTDLAPEPRAFLLGLLIGDGCCTNAVQVPTLACCDPTLILDIADRLKSMGLKASDDGSGKSYRISQTKLLQAIPHSRGGRCAENPLKTWLKELHLWGKYSYEKFIPSIVDSWDNSAVSSLIGGLFSTDGCVYSHQGGRPGLSYVSTSLPLIVRLKELLETRFGIYGGSITKNDWHRDPKARRCAYRLYITAFDSVLKFQKLIPLFGIKNQKLISFTMADCPKTSYRSGVARRQSLDAAIKVRTFDIEVDHPDHLFVLGNGLVVSNSIMQSPETFPHRAAVAELEGKVDSIEDAPQGGKFVTVGGQKHYALPGYATLVKPGDKVERGDQLSDGIVDVNDIVRLRGLGEGRRYYVDRVRQALADSGAGSASRRNLELVARGALDHVRVTADEGVGEYLPDDLGSYNRLAVTYSPPAHIKSVPVQKAVGQFLHAPALHYTIGTQLTNRMAQDLEKAGFKDVMSDPEAPPFEPEMVRLRGSQSGGTDWLAKFHTSNLGRNVGLDAERARDTNLKSNVHFVPRLAIGENFGENIEQTGKF